MKIFVVDDKPEAARALAQSLREATDCEVFSPPSGQVALDMALKIGAPDVLITEVVMEGVDGFNLRESFLVSRPDLWTIYVTGYNLDEYQEYINGAPILYKPAAPADVVAALPPEAQRATPAPAPEPAPSEPTPQETYARNSTTDNLPLDQRTRSARLRRLVDKQGFTGKLDQFELVDIIQMCCVSKRTGCLQIARRDQRGVIYLRGGQIIHGVSGELEGEEAVYQIIGWSAGQFNFEEGVQPPAQTIQGGWEHVVMEAVRRRDEQDHARQSEEKSADAPAELTGQSIGPYRLRRLLGQGERSQVFEAVQTSMERTVTLKVLRPEFQSDEITVQDFFAEASAKANVQHPSILAVYEAGHADDFNYYAREYVDGHNLTDLRAQGRTIDDAAALQLIRVATEAFAYLSQNKIPCAPLKPDDLYLGRDRYARLNNLAIVPDEKSPPIQQEIRALSHMVTDCLPGHSAASPELRALLGRMLLEGNGGFLSWAALLQAVKALEPKVVPEDAFKLSAQDAAAIAAVNDAKRRQKRALIFSTLGMFALFWLIGAVVYFQFFRVTVKDFNKLVEIPAGEFIYQDGKKMTLPTFWIDEYEVTIGQYAQFLDALKAKPTDAYEHPDAPKPNYHDNNKWNTLYEVAKGGGNYNGVRIDPNYPAVFVNWFDAYAYAKWKGRRLPTEEEWEKAGRGTDGRRFPWGNDPTNVSKVNTSADHTANNARAKAEKDGYNFWAPVDEMTGDKSPYGVMGMAGNVSEWTATLTHKGPVTYPVVRGGNFGSADIELTRRVTSLADLLPNDRVGFRTATDTPPAAKK
jgi:CheY-like chemotaxis protein